MSSMKGVNVYHRELTSEEIRDQVHRKLVGGMWDELGPLQFEFLVEAGLKPHHKLLDIGCGCLRGGIHFLDYLEPGHYFGLDINRSLIEAGIEEVERAGLSEKKPNLVVDDQFSLGQFQTKFDFMVSISVFTHLPHDIIVRCLSRARENLAPDGTYYSTYFEAPTPAHVEPIVQEPGGRVTHYDSDPFHYSIDELASMATLAQLELDVIGDWQHPRNQKMAAFRLPR